MNIKNVKVGYLKTNCYILEKEDKCLIIDPGDEFDKIDKNISGDPIGILLTHSHFDHIGALEGVKNKYNIPVYKFENLKEENIELGPFKFQVIYTLGHTDDSVTYYFFEDNVIFTGDFLFKECIGRCDLPTGDENEMRLSIEKIKKYDEKINIYPGHDEFTTLQNELKNNIYFK